MLKKTKCKTQRVSLDNESNEKQSHFIQVPTVSVAVTGQRNHPKLSLIGFFTAKETLIESEIDFFKSRKRIVGFYKTKRNCALGNW